MNTKLLLTTIILFGFSFLNAQNIPYYVPTNGLIGWWSFSGNAMDVSISANNGIVNGAILTTDRFGNTNSAYSFDGVLNSISVPNIALSGNASRSVFAWVKTNTQIGKTVVGTAGSSANAGEFNLVVGYGPGSTNYPGKVGVMGGNFTTGGHDFYPNSGTSVNDNIWHNVGAVYDGNSTLKIYVDGVLVNTTSITYNTIGQINFFGYNNHNGSQWVGSLDDIGIWNRVLTQLEITALFNAENSNSCQILVINTGVLGFNPIAYKNTLTIYPNPTNDQITIDCGAIANVVGYHIEIANTLGQVVFNKLMNVQQYVVPLNTWGGTGVYFVKVYDASGNVLSTKKIILQ